MSIAKNGLDGSSPLEFNSIAGYTRRDVLKYSLGSAIAAGTLGSLAEEAATMAGAATLKPKRGGTLHLGGQGGASNDNLDAQNPLTNCDYPRIYALYSALVKFDANAKPVLDLAESITPNKDATLWTIRVRPGVVCHNGKSFGAADVLFSLRRIVNPKAPLPGWPVLTPLNLANAKILDPLTLRIPCKTPFSTFIESLTDPFILMVPTGYDPKHPVGTGPFKFKSFTPGVQSVFTRNENFYLNGKPYADELIVSDYPSEQSQVNGLLGGTVNLINFLSADSIAPLKNGKVNLVISKTGGWNPITMRVDRAPFNDVRVRQALKLVINRPEMLNLVFGGYGSIANDVFGKFDAEYDRSIPQHHQDIAQAKFLLKKAGHENLKVQLTTSSGIGQGTIKTAEVYAQQAQSAGVTVNINQVTSSTWFGQDYLKVPFGQDYWFYLPYLVNVPQVTIPGGAFNTPHYNNPKYTALYKEALRSTDKARQTELAHAMQRIDWSDGGLIIPYFPPVIDATAKNVKGVVPSPSFPLSNYDWASIWID
jgi:peptide/nickel transport system substrate-binding protein